MLPPPFLNHLNHVGAVLVTAPCSANLTVSAGDLWFGKAWAELVGGARKSRHSVPGQGFSALFELEIFLSTPMPTVLEVSQKIKESLTPLLPTKEISWAQKI